MSQSPQDSSEHQLHEDGRKRVAKACDRCRLKKIKCDGRIPCTRCKFENAVCRFGDRRKTVERRVPPGYVEYLEEQQRVLVTALRMAYKAVPKANTSPDVSVHQILEHLGILRDTRHSTVLNSPFHFEEDLDKLRDHWEEHADGASDDHSVPASVPSLSPTTSFSNDSGYASPTSLDGRLSSLPTTMPPPSKCTSRPSFASSTSSFLSEVSRPLHAYQMPCQPYPSHRSLPESPAPQQTSDQDISPMWMAMPGNNFAHFPVQSSESCGLENSFEATQAAFDVFAATHMTVAPAALQGSQPGPFYPANMDVDDYVNPRKWAARGGEASWSRVGM